MRRVLTMSLVLLLVVVSAAPGAGEKAAARKKLAGTWKRTVGENSILFTFKGNVLHVTLKIVDNSMEVDADYGVTKDGVLFGRINKVNKADDGPSEGDLFSFRFSVDANTLTLSDLKTPHDNADAKDLFQGDYHKQKEKAK